MFKTIYPKAACAALLLVFAAGAVPAAPPGDESGRWRDVATERDRGRIRGWRDAWVEALGQARRAHAADLNAAGTLLEPDAALSEAAPPAGSYRCRTIKLGGQTRATPDWVQFPWFTCRVGRYGETLSFSRIGGSQRPIGRLYPAGPRRLIFLGSLQLGDERQVLRYGTDADRDLAGIFERVGERRWRLVFPRPVFESIVDVIELVPA